MDKLIFTYLKNIGKKLRPLAQSFDNYLLITGLPLVFPNFSKVSKKRIFRSIFSLKLSIRLKTVLKSIETYNRFYKANFNIKKKNLSSSKLFFIKKHI